PAARARPSPWIMQYVIEPNAAPGSRLQERSRGRATYSAGTIYQDARAPETGRERRHEVRPLLRVRRRRRLQGAAPLPRALGALRGVPRARAAVDGRDVRRPAEGRVDGDLHD